jgi:HK97 family phage portal protein
MVELIDHPFLTLMNSVSDIYDSYTLMENTEAYLGLLGNAFWRVEKDQTGKPVSIEVLPAEYVSVLVDKDNKITGYRLQIDGTGYRREYAKDEVVHFKMPAPGAFRRVNINLNGPTGLYGMGHLEGCLAEAQLLESINTYERTLMDNHGRPDFVVHYTQGQLEETQQKKLTKQWNSIFKGLRNQGKPAILDNQFEIKELGFNPKDLQYQEGKKWLRNAICNSFGINENLVSVENANRASSETAIEQYYHFTILPKLRRIQEVINAGILNMYDDGLWMVFDDPRPENGESVTKKETADIANGIRSINEIRQERGMDPISGDEYELPHHHSQSREYGKASDTNQQDDTSRK